MVGVVLGTRKYDSSALQRMQGVTVAQDRRDGTTGCVSSCFEQRMRQGCVEIRFSSISAARYQLYQILPSRRPMGAHRARISGLR